MSWQRKQRAEAARALLRRGTGEAASASSATESLGPLARRNELGELVCRLCHETLGKSDALWRPHCLTRTHKLRLLKLRQVRQERAAASGVRDTNTTATVVTSSTVENRAPSPKEPARAPPPTAAGSSSLLGVAYGSDDDDDDDDDDNAPASDQVETDETKKGDDEGKKEAKQNQTKDEGGEKDEEESIAAESGVLPRGFFDDAQRDKSETQMVRTQEQTEKLDADWLSLQAELTFDVHGLKDELELLDEEWLKEDVLGEHVFDERGGALNIAFEHLDPVDSEREHQVLHNRALRIVEMRASLDEKKQQQKRARETSSTSPAKRARLESDEDDDSSDSDDHDDDDLDLFAKGI